MRILAEMVMSPKTLRTEIGMSSEAGSWQLEEVDEILWDG